MTAWIPMLKNMRGLMKPRIMTISQLADQAQKVRPGVARGTLYRWVNEMERAGILRSLSDGMYVNMLAQPAPTPAAAASFLRKGAVVSLQSALGEAGMDNNPSAIVTAIIPVKNFKESYPRPGDLSTGFGRFRFYTMPAELFSPSIGRDDDLFDMTKPYQMSTPEKAILDWLYIHHSSRISRSQMRRMAPPHMDLDLSSLNYSRLHRLANKMGLEQPLEQWLEAKARYDNDANVQNNMSLSLGF